MLIQILSASRFARGDSFTKMKSSSSRSRKSGRQKCLGQFLKIIESPNLDVSAVVDYSQGLASKQLIVG